MARTYKWQPHSGHRHAIPQALAVHDAGHTLCGLEVTVGPDKWPNETRYWSTCTECDLAWREHEGLLPWPRKADDVAPSPSCRPAASNDDLIGMLSLVIDTLVGQMGGQTSQSNETSPTPSVSELESAR